MNLFLELQGQQDSTELNVSSIMKSYDTVSRGNDEIVASDISAQVENLQSKLEKRRTLC